MTDLTPQFGTKKIPRSWEAATPAIPMWSFLFFINLFSLFPSFFQTLQKYFTCLDFEFWSLLFCRGFSWLFLVLFFNFWSFEIFLNILLVLPYFGCLWCMIRGTHYFIKMPKINYTKYNQYHIQQKSSTILITKNESSTINL